MEGAVRLFAGEFSRSSLTVPDQDGKSAAWVVTPTGAACRLVFVAGALVDVQENADMLSARVADPTGGFDLICGGNNTSLAESIRKIPLPSFVSVTGRAQLFRRDGRAVQAIRPELVHVIDRHTRDQWVVTTAAATLARLGMMHRTLQGTCTDSRLLQACTHYSLSRKDLDELSALVATALSSVRPPGESKGIVGADPRDMVMEFIRSAGGPRGVAVEDILEMARQRAVPQESVLAAIESLIVDDECYQPQKGYVKLL